MGEVTTKHGGSYQMKGSSHDRRTPRLKLINASVEYAGKEVNTPLGSRLVSPTGVPLRKPKRGLASESEQDLVYAQALENMSDAQEAEKKHVWRNSDGVEFVIHTPPGLKSNKTTVEIQEKPGREEF